MGLEMCVIFNRVVEECLRVRWYSNKALKDVREPISFVATWKGAFLARENNKCKGPGAGGCLGVPEEQ